jgi:hypothetical protein
MEKKMIMDIGGSLVGVTIDITESSFLIGLLGSTTVDINFF